MQQDFWTQLTTGIGSDSGVLMAALGVILVSGPSIKRFCHWLGIPSSVGFIVLGLLLGALLDSPEGAKDSIAGAAFSVLAQLGVIALLFRVGLKSHTSALIRKLPDASLVWIGNVLGSTATGYLVSRYVFDWSLETSLVIGTAFSATSIAVSMAVWDELGLADSDEGALLLDVAELDDLSAAVILAVLLGTLPALLNGSDGIWLAAGSASVVVLVKLAAFVAGCYLFAHYLEERFTAFNRRMSDTPASLTISILGAGLVIAALAESLGFSVAIGALFAGLAFSRDQDAVRTDGGFTYLHELLAPFFFIHIGMQTDVAALAGAVDTGLLLLLAAAASKLIFTFLPAILSMGSREAMALGVSMIPRAEIALVVVYECRLIDPEIVPPTVFSGMVLVSLGTSMLSPILLRRLLDRES